MAVVRYLVRNVDEAVAFYTRHLGFTQESRWGPAFAIVAKGDLRLWLSGPQSSAARPMPDGRQPIPGGWNRIVVETDDRRRADAAGRGAVPQWDREWAGGTADPGGGRRRESRGAV